MIQILVLKSDFHIQHIGCCPSSRYLAYFYLIVDKIPPCLDVGVYGEMVGWIFPQAYGGSEEIWGKVASL